MFRQTVPYPKGWKSREWKEYIKKKYGTNSNLYKNFSVKRSIAVYCSNYRKEVYNG